MKNIMSKSCMAILVLFVFMLISGCGDNDKTKKESPEGVVGTNQIQTTAPLSPVAPDVAVGQDQTGDVAVSVDGRVLKKTELENNVKEKIKFLKDKIPAGKQKEYRDGIRKQLVDAFIMRTLLNNEFAKRKIEANNQDIKMMLDKLKAGLPQDKKIDDFIKENRISQEDILFAVKVNKFMNMEMGEKPKPTQKEINKFYKENSAKLFKEPESVHVRHILVAVSKNDNDNNKAQKKEKIENLRRQLLSGGDFAELARKNSDCPSKETGGDLKFITRGLVAKPFEDAAFSQQKNIIGPVITTESGYHIIQVLDLKPARTISLDEAKGKIAAHLQRQKNGEAFSAILKNLQKKAKIIIY